MDLSMTQDEKTTLLRRFDPTPPPSPFRLVIVSGPDAGKVFQLDGSEPSRILVGHAEACTIKLEDSTVSRRHAALEVEGTRVRLSDLGSTNGLFVGELQVKEAMLSGGELVRLGESAFRLERDVETKRIPLSSRTRFGRILGASTEMRRLYPLAERLAASDVPVVIEGESGTGKELMAESIHEEGPRADAPFIILDCGAIPTTLLSGELFGAEPGEDGEGVRRRGVFEQADGGTLFINEIAELDLNLQRKLLRTLSKREVRLLGSDRAIGIDVRVIASTKKDLDREVQAGRFSEELFQRLAVGRLELPPLRRRKGDVAILVAHFCKELEGSEDSIPSAIRHSWEDLDWPGNVRELRNTIARYLALGELAQMTNQTTAPKMPEGGTIVSDWENDFIEEVLELPLGEARQRVIHEFEKRYVARLLEEHNGNVTHAAESAGVARRYFQILKARTSKAFDGD